MKIAIIGAGPGGLVAALYLQHDGHDVEIYEKSDKVGGRSQRLQLGNYTFDTGPTFLMYLEVLEDLCKTINYDLLSTLNITKLDPLYTLYMKGKTITFTANQSLNEAHIETLFPNQGARYIDFLHDENKRFEALKHIMTTPFESAKDLLNPKLIKASRFINPKESIQERLSHYFESDDLKTALSFQSKYLGMSPTEAPAFFTMLSFLEHQKGLYHIEGGINALHQKMADYFISQGGTIHYNKTLKNFNVSQKMIKDMTFSDGTSIAADIFVSNIDVSHMLMHNFNKSNLKHFTQEKLNTLDYSLSTFNLYLGLNKKLDLTHHAFLFPENYTENAQRITKDYLLPEDLMIYIHNPSALDAHLAPPNHSSLYILVPVPNNRSKIDWSEEKSSFKEKVLATIEEKLNLTLKDAIQEEKIITPYDWEHDYNVHLGAVFNLSHKLSQMLHKRPHNHYKDFQNLFLVGGGTHPGSGLPTIYQSALITRNLINKRGKKKKKN